MDYKIIGQTVPVVEITLNSGETVYTQRGGMTYQSDGILMKTNARGGIMKGINMLYEENNQFIIKIGGRSYGNMYFLTQYGKLMYGYYNFTGDESWEEK